MNPEDTGQIGQMLSGFLGQISLWGIVLGTIFGGVGFVSFRYGRKQEEVRPTVLGIVLMLYTLVIYNVWAILIIGSILTTLIFYPKTE